MSVRLRQKKIKTRQSWKQNVFSSLFKSDSSMQIWPDQIPVAVMKRFALISIWSDSWNISDNFTNISGKHLRFNILFLGHVNIYFSCLSFLFKYIFF